MLRLTRLKIHRFRHVAPNTELVFGPTFNVLLGKNGTGKTTLLKIIAAIVKDDLSEFESEEQGFHLEYELEDESGSFMRVDVLQPSGQTGTGERDRGRHARPFADGSIRIVSDGATRTWKVGGLRAAGVQPLELRTPLTGRWFRSDLLHSIWAQNLDGFLSATALDLSGWVGRLDEGTEVLGELIQSAMVSGTPLRPQFVDGTRQARVFHALFVHWTWSDLSAEISSDASLLLKEMSRQLGFEAATASFRVNESTSTGREFNRPDLIFRRVDGTVVRHDNLSFGQKRMLAFLWACELGLQTPVVADELVNGLHHQWIAYVMREKLGKRQSFLATQNPLLLDYVPVEDEADAQKKFVRCTVENDEQGREQMCWRNLAVEEAHRLVSALQVGVQHVSEILRDEGLW